MWVFNQYLRPGHFSRSEKGNKSCPGKGKAAGRYLYQTIRKGRVEEPCWKIPKGKSRTHDQKGIERFIQSSTGNSFKAHEGKSNCDHGKDWGKGFTCQHCPDFSTGRAGN